ncbi:MAG: trigger factor [Hyphomicrobiales bacterium]
MIVTETLNEGLKRELRVVVSADELENKLVTRLDEMKSRVRLRGFRPGKVPLTHLRKVYGRSVMADVVQKAVEETSRKTLEQRKEEPACPPDIVVDEDRRNVDRIMEGKTDLAFTMSFEVMPSFEIVDFSSVKLEKPVAAIEDEELDGAIALMVERHRDFEPRDGQHEAQDGDRLTIDFEGRIDGDPFKGGLGQGVALRLGSGDFMAGFEDQLVGARADEDRNVTVTFPQDYTARHLAGKQAVFAVRIKQVASPRDIVFDDTFAQKAGLESLDALKRHIQEQLEARHEVASREKLKRQLFDQLAAAYDFALPEKMVEREFQTLWNRLSEGMKREGQSFADEGTSEGDARAEYAAIARRRVRLGLVLRKIAKSNGVKVGDRELQAALLERCRQFPGQERQVFDYYKRNPQAMSALHDPLLERKVVDLILDRVEVKDVPVGREALFADPDNDNPEDQQLTSGQRRSKTSPMVGANAELVQQDEVAQ